MNYIKHLTGFFDKVMRDDRLHPTHISLYISLFQFWNVQRFKNPISISRDEVMRVSKICSKATYHKCMKDLHNFSYLNYDPSFNPYRGSLVTLFDLELTHQQVQKKASKKTIFLPSTEQVLNPNQTGAEQELVPSINSLNLLNNTNDLNLGEHSQKNIHENFNSNENSKINSEKQGSEKEKSSAKKEKVSLEHIKNYFAENNWPTMEAEKFYNHYESNGWLIGGRSPMKNWQASASNWMLNEHKFSNGKTTTAGKLNASTDKNYAEPL